MYTFVFINKNEKNLTASILINLLILLFEL